MRTVDFFSPGDLVRPSPAGPGMGIQAWNGCDGKNMWGCHDRIHPREGLWAVIQVIPPISPNYVWCPVKIVHGSGRVKWVSHFEIQKMSLWLEDEDV